MTIGKARSGPSGTRLRARHATLSAARIIDSTAGELMPHPVTILLVEDDSDDEALTVMALRGVPATLEVARDGQEAMDYLTNDGKAMPRLVLLDLKLPKIDGLEVLRRIREDDRTRLTPGSRARRRRRTPRRSAELCESFDRRVSTEAREAAVGGLLMDAVPGT